MYEAYYSGGWIVEDMTGGNDLAALNGGITSFWNPQYNLQEVFYVGANQHVYEAYYSSGWIVGDTTGNGYLAMVLYTISGQVTAGGSALPGVTVTLNGTTAVGTSFSQAVATDSNGNYSLMAPVGGNWTVTPSLAANTFSPASDEFTDLTVSEVADFEASSGTGTDGVSSVNGYYGLYTPPHTTPSGTGCGDISGSWTETDQYGSSTWNLTEDTSGNVSGTVDFTNGGSCGTITYQTVTGSQSNGVFTLTASNPRALQDSCGYAITPTEQQSVTLSPSGSCASGSANWSSEFGAGTSSWKGQIPTSLRVVSSRILSDAEMTAAGCLSTFTGLYFQIVYQVLDNSSPPKPVKRAGLVPQEQLLNHTLRVPSLFLTIGPEDEQRNWGDITSGMVTDSNGQFSDHPFGQCGGSEEPGSSAPGFTATFTQNIRVVNRRNQGASGILRSNNWIQTAPAPRKGSLTNGVDVNLSQ